MLGCLIRYIFNILCEFLIGYRFIIKYMQKMIQNFFNGTVFHVLEAIEV